MQFDTLVTYTTMYLTRRTRLQGARWLSQRATRVDGTTPWTKDRHSPLTGLVGAENRGRKACPGRIRWPKQDRRHPSQKNY